MKSKRFFRLMFATTLLGFMAGTLYAEQPWINPEEMKTTVRGIIVDPEGKPVANAEICSDFQDVRTQSDETGRFEMKLQNVSFRQLRVWTSDRSLVALSEYLTVEPKDPETGEIRIPLVSSRKITGKVLDEKGNSLTKAKVWCATINETVTDISETNTQGEFTLFHPSNQPLILVAARDAKAGLDLVRVGEEGGPFTITLTGGVSVRFRIVDENNEPVPQARVATWFFRGKDEKNANPAAMDFMRSTANEQGFVVHEGLPNWTIQPVGFYISDTKTGSKLLSQSMKIDLSTPVAEYDITLIEGVFVRGTVSLPDGSPAAGWHVNLFGENSPQYFTTTDQRGRYSILVQKNLDVDLSVKNPNYYLETQKKPEAAAPIRFDLKSGKDGLSGVDVQLQKPVRVFGKITGNPPLEHTGRIQYFGILQPNPKIAEVKQSKEGTRLQGTVVTENDTYETWLAPGKYVLNFRDRYYGQEPYASVPIEITDQTELEIDFDNTKFVTPLRKVTLRVSQIKDGEELKPAASAQVVFAPVNEEDATSNNRVFWEEFKTDENGELQAELPPCPVRVFVLSSDRRFGAFVPLAEGENETKIELKPTVSARGRLVQENDADQALGNCSVKLAVKEAPGVAWVDTLTDGQGSFAFDGLIPEVEYRFLLPQMPRDWPEIRYSYSWRHIREEIAESGKTMELGTIAGSTSFDVAEMEWAFSQVYHVTEFKTPGALFNEFLSRAKNDKRKILVLFSTYNHESPLFQFLSMDLAYRLFSDPDIKPFTDRYYFLGVATDERNWRGESPYALAKTFVKRHGITEDALEQITLCVFDAEGTLLHTDHLLEVMEPRANTIPMEFRVNKERLLELLDRWSR